MQKYTKNHHRSHPARLGAIVLAAITMFGMTELGRHQLVRLESTAAHNVASILSHTLEKENETTRMPVRFEDGLRSPTIGGI